MIAIPPDGTFCPRRKRKRRAAGTMAAKNPGYRCCSGGAVGTVPGGQDAATGAQVTGAHTGAQAVVGT